MAVSNPYLTCKRVRYYCLKDEDAFFEWIKKIKSIEKFEGAGVELYLDFATTTIPDEDLKELLALFYRYKVDMNQLKMFLTEENKDWFCDKTAYWYKKVFGTKDKK